MHSVLKILIWVCFIAWVFCLAQGSISYMTLEAVGSGFTRGSNRIGAFLRWEGLGLIVALASFVLGRLTDAKGGTRLAARLPLLISGGGFLLLALLVAGVFIYVKIVG